MCRANELDAAFRDRSGSCSFGFAPDLVDDDHLRVVIFHGFDHHLMLKHGLAHLHTARFSHCRMRHIAITADFIGGIHDDNALRLSNDARGFTQQSGLTHTRTSKDQHGLARFDNILDDIHCAIDSAPNAQRKSNNGRASVADGRDTM